MTALHPTDLFPTIFITDAGLFAAADLVASFVSPEDHCTMLPERVLIHACNLWEAENGDACDKNELMLVQLFRGALREKLRVKG